MTFTLALTGDTMITRGALVSVDNRAVQLQALLRDADVSFTNLEVVASDLQGFHSSGAFTPTLLSLPVEWTDVVAEDSFVVVAAGRSPFCTAGLLEVADLVARLRVERSAADRSGVKRITP